MEVRLNQNIFIMNDLTKICFNPCFNGSETKSRQVQTQSHLGYGVSILVLMEVRLNLLLSKARHNAQQRFNPCFNGSETKSEIIEIITPISGMFQSLF